VNGSLTGEIARTRKRARLSQAKGGWSSEERRSSSRERRVFEGGYAGSFVLRRERAARSDYRRKTSRIGKAHAFHEAPAEPVLAASGPTLGARRNAGPDEREGGGDRDVRGARVRALSEEDNASRRATPGRQSENRVVKRGSPRPRSHRAAPSLPLHTSRVFGRARWARKETFRAYEHGAARLRDESDLRACAARLRAGFGSLRWETAKHECSSWKRFRSANVDRTHRRSRRPRELPSDPADTRDLARRKRRQAFDAQGGVEGERQRCAGLEAFLQRRCRGITNRTRKPRRDRTRRGAGSGTREVPGPRARGDRYDGRVSGSRTCPPKPGACSCGSGLEGKCPASLRASGAAGGAATEVRTPVPSRRRRHSEVGTVSFGSSSCALPLREAWREGSAPTTRRLHKCGAGRRRCEARGFAAGLAGQSRAGRRATRGVRRARPTEAGDG